MFAGYHHSEKAVEASSIMKLIKLAALFIISCSILESRKVDREPEEEVVNLRTRRWSLFPLPGVLQSRIISVSKMMELIGNAVLGVRKETKETKDSKGANDLLEMESLEMRIISVSRLTASIRNSGLGVRKETETVEMEPLEENQVETTTAIQVEEETSTEIF